MRRRHRLFVRSLAGCGHAALPAPPKRAPSRLPPLPPSRGGRRAAPAAPPPSHAPSTPPAAASGPRRPAAAAGAPALPASALNTASALGLHGEVVGAVRALAVGRDVCNKACRRQAGRRAAAGERWRPAASAPRRPGTTPGVRPGGSCSWTPLARRVVLQALAVDDLREELAPGLRVDAPPEGARAAGGRERRRRRRRRHLPATPMSAGRHERAMTCAPALEWPTRLRASCKPATTARDHMPRPGLAHCSVPISSASLVSSSGMAFMPSGQRQAARAQSPSASRSRSARFIGGCSAAERRHKQGWWSGAAAGLGPRPANAAAPAQLAAGPAWY